MGLCEEDEAEISHCSWSIVGFFPPPSYPLNVPVWLKGKGNFASLGQPLGRWCGPSLRTSELGGEGRLRRNNGDFFSKHGTSLPLTASVARKSLEVIEKHPIPRANPFFVWQLLFQQGQKHVEVWSVWARKAAPITLLSLLKEILEST